MAHIRKYRNGYRAEIRIDGVRKSRMFKTKRDAQIWINDIELNGIASGMVVSRLLERYRDEISVTKKGEKWERDRIGTILRHPISTVRLDKLRPKHLSSWIDDRLKVVQSSTVNREINLLSSVSHRLFTGG